MYDQARNHLHVFTFSHVVGCNTGKFDSSPNGTVQESDYEVPENIMMRKLLDNDKYSKSRKRTREKIFVPQLCPISSDRQ